MNDGGDASLLPIIIRIAKMMPRAKSVTTSHIGQSARSAHTPSSTLIRARPDSPTLRVDTMASLGLVDPQDTGGVGQTGVLPSVSVLCPPRRRGGPVQPPSPNSSVAPTCGGHAEREGFEPSKRLYTP